MHPGCGGPLAQVVPVGFHGAEGDAAEAVDLEHHLGAGGGGNDEDVGFFAHADLVADGVDGVMFLVGVQGEVVQAAVGEAVTVIWYLLLARRVLWHGEG